MVNFYLIFAWVVAIACAALAFYAPKPFTSARIERRKARVYPWYQDIQ